MKLSENELIKIVQTPPNAQSVKKGEMYQSRLRILTKAYNAQDIYNESGWQEIQYRLAEKFTAEKYNTILKYFTFPLAVVNITNDVLTDLYYVFNSKNASFDIEFPNERAKETIESAIAKLDLRYWIEQYGGRSLY